MTWTGAKRPYDLVKELVIAVVAISLLSAGLSLVFSSPDEPQVTLAEWATQGPNNFLLTAAAELDGTSGTATYGAPYTHDSSAGQKLGPLPLQRWGGVSIPIDSAQDFVVHPLQLLPAEPALQTALAAWTSASSDQQSKWASAYDDALTNAPDNDPAKVATGDYGPVPAMLGRLLDDARSGGLDGALLTQGSFYQTDYTRPLLFMADGTYLEDKARAQHLGGDQWGMMNETGNYPGQPWLWLFALWYQVKPFSTSDNADALVWGLMVLLTTLLILVPFIPGLRSVPKKLGIYKLIWRDYYRAQSGG